MEAPYKSLKNFWKDYAEAFSHPLTSNSLLGKFVNNPNVTGAYAESWLRSITASMLSQFRISTGTIIRPSDRLRPNLWGECRATGASTWNLTAEAVPF